jgi:hypothetical protein
LITIFRDFLVGEPLSFSVLLLFLGEEGRLSVAIDKVLLGAEMTVIEAGLELELEFKLSLRMKFADDGPRGLIGWSSSSESDSLMFFVGAAAREGRSRLSGLEGTFIMVAVFVVAQR